MVKSEGYDGCQNYFCPESRFWRSMTQFEMLNSLFYIMVLLFLKECLLKRWNDFHGKQNIQFNYKNEVCRLWAYEHSENKPVQIKLPRSYRQKNIQYFHILMEIITFILSFSQI